MAVQRNPYRYWEDERGKSDYRSKQTQAFSFVRQMLRQSEYLRDSNRVNPGPMRNTRAVTADSKTQIPHDIRNEDMWGWQSWLKPGIYLEESTVSDSLLEVVESGYSEYLQIDETHRPDQYEPGQVITPVQKVRVYTHHQSVASTEWIINHNLGSYPSVELLNSDLKEIDGSVIHLSPNTTKVVFTVAITGYARLIVRTTAFFTFEQIQPAQEWHIVHNLGYLPSVELLSSDRKEIEGNVVHTSLNSIRVEFTTPIGGYALLN